jgi:hypothetical protein
MHESSVGRSQQPAHRGDTGDNITRNHFRGRLVITAPGSPGFNNKLRIRDANLGELDSRFPQTAPDGPVGRTNCGREAKLLQRIRSLSH